MLFRRSAFLTGALMAPLAVHGQGLVSIRLAGTPARDVLGALWAKQSSIFLREGLDVDIQSLNSGAAVSAAVVGGSIDIGKSSLFGLITAFAKGVPFVVEVPAAIWTSDVPNSALLVGKDAPIHDARDLNGKTIAVSGLGDLFTVADSAWIDQNGGDSRTVKFLEMPDRAAAEAISSGRIDAAAFAEPLITDALKSGKYRILGYTMNGIAKQFIASAYFCSKDYAAKNADVLARFRKGVYEGVAYAETHRAEMIPVIAKYSKVDEQTVASMSKAPLGNASMMTARMIQPMIDMAVKYKVIPKSFPAKDMIDPAALAPNSISLSGEYAS